MDFGKNAVYNLPLVCYHMAVCLKASREGGKSIFGEERRLSPCSANPPPRAR